jgi:hypothetical protein
MITKLINFIKNLFKKKKKSPDLKIMFDDDIYIKKI